MTFYDLTTTITLQGNIEVKIFNHLGDEIDSRFFRDLDDFSISCTETEDLEDCEVTYIYSKKSCDGTAWLTVEVAFAE